MARVKIERYGLAWSDRGNGGRIRLRLEGGESKELDITNPMEFVAISSILGRGGAHYVDDHIITNGWMAP